MSNRLIQFLCLLLAVAALVGAGLLTRPIEQKRKELQLELLGNSQADVSPAISLFLQAGGPLRGLAINTLWFQVEQAKEQGQFYALDRYCRLIINLQPNNPDAVRTEAWNLAYNVSVSVPNEDLRWIWVRKGIILLRDDGIRYNPTAAPLYKDLAWTFFHKIGGASDDARWYYVFKLAEEWQEILGLPDPTLTDAQQIARFAEIAQAPGTLNELLRTHPQVKPLIQRFRALGFEPDGHLLKEIGRMVMFNHARDAHLADVAVQDLPEKYDSRLAPILMDPDPAQAAALDALLAYMRKSVIVNEYHMEPEFMWKLMRPAAAGGYGFGPIDFRTAEAHAVYWSALGIVKAGGLKNHADQEQVSTFNQMVLALKQMMEYGKVTIDPTSGYVNRSPDVRFADAYLQALRDAMEKQQQGILPADTVMRFDEALESVLEEAVTLAYAFGKKQDAERYYQQLRQGYGNKPGRIYNTTPLDDYAYKSQQAMIGNDINPFLLGTLEQAFVNLRENNVEAFDRLLAMAKKAYDDYQATVVHTPAMSRDRMSLGPFDRYVMETYVRVLTSSGSAYMAARLWAATPPIPVTGGMLKQRVYKDVMPVLIQQCRMARPPVDPNLAFPPPPGVEPYRATTLPAGG